MQTSNESTTTCLVCNRQFKRVTNTHLATHGLDETTYKEQYPNAVLVPKQLALDCQATRRGRTYEEVHGTERGAALREERRVQAVAQMRNPAQRALRVETSKFERTPEMRKHISLGKRGISPTQESLERGVRTQVRNGNARTSKLELRVHALLDELHLVYLKQVPMDRYILDIYLPILHIAIEVDGTFWHGNAEMLAHDAKRNWRLAVMHELAIIHLSEKEIMGGLTAFDLARRVLDLRGDFIKEFMGLSGLQG